MENNIQEIREWIKLLSYSPDPKYWIIENMNAEDIFNWLYNFHLDDEDVILKILNFIKDNNLIK